MRTVLEIPAPKGKTPPLGEECGGVPAPLNLEGIGAGADQVRARDQSQDRQGPRSRRAANAARPRRRGDRVKTARLRARALKLGFVRRVISEAIVGDQLWQIRISSSAV